MSVRAADEFDYNAPQFIDFENLIDDDEADKYFEETCNPLSTSTNHVYKSELESGCSNNLEQQDEHENVFNKEGEPCEEELLNINQGLETCNLVHKKCNYVSNSESPNCTPKSSDADCTDNVNDEQHSVPCAEKSISNKNSSSVSSDHNTENEPRKGSKTKSIETMLGGPNNASKEAEKNKVNRRSGSKNYLGNLSNVAKSKTTPPTAALQPKATALSAQRQKLVGKENKGVTPKTTPTGVMAKSTFQRNSANKLNLSGSKTSRLKPPSPSFYTNSGRRRSLSCDSLPISKKLPAPRENNMKLKLRTNSKDQIKKPVPLKAMPLKDLHGDSANLTADKRLKSYPSSHGSQDSLSSSSTYSSCRRRSFSANDQRNDGKTKYVSMAEAIIHFQKDTPDRFHSRPRTARGLLGTPTLKGRPPSPQPTIPYSPHLLSKLRNRPTNALSQQEREELELEEIRKHQIKARPINDGIFKEPKLPKKKETKPVTVVEPFNLTEIKKKVIETEEEAVRFVARPVPKAILEKPCGLGEKRAIPLTVPKSPMLKLKYMVAACQEKSTPQVEEEHTVIKAKPVPYFGVPFLVQTAEKKITHVQPFSFEERNKEITMKKEKKIKEILEEEKRARLFHAKPMPVFTSPGLPDRSTIMITKPKPFNLAAYQLAVQEKDKSQELEKEIIQFQARPAKVLERPPFKPQLPDNHSLEIFDFQLNTEKRAQERQTFDNAIKQRESELEAAKRELLRQREEEEKEEIARLRKDMVSKAQPVRHFLPVVPAPSEKPLTDPHTPKFSKRFNK